MLTFKISFYFVVEAGVELFFFGVEKIKVKAMLGIGEAIIRGGEPGFKRTRGRAKRIGAVRVSFDFRLSEA